MHPINTLATLWDAICWHPWITAWIVIGAILLILILWSMIPELMRYLKIERM